MYKRFLIISLALMLTASWVGAQTFRYTDSISVDPSVRIGRLDNGLIYYIRQNKKPENRIELRLAVNAGSILETEGQKGLAHFTEHMCFNGTTHFPKNELVDYLQKTGVKFGADINAYTSFDETVYMLQLPADNKELMDQGFQVIEDWAHNVSFEDKEIDKERGVIVEEWRLGLGANDRMRKKYFPLIFKGSLYAERLPIGDVNVIRNFKYDTIRQFYKDWYRPNLQAVIVVGDFDPDEMEAKVKAHFSGIKNPENPRERTIYTIPENEDAIIAIASDPEATSSNVQIFYKHPKEGFYTLWDFRRRVLAELYNGMLSERLREYMQDPESPVIYAYNYYGRFLARTSDAFTLSASVKENRIPEAVRLLVLESERARQHGFLQTELDRMKQDLLSRYEKQALEFDKTESSKLANQYVSHFLSGTSIAGAQTEYNYLKFLLENINLPELNELSDKWITDKNLNVVITAPDKPEITLPTEQQIINIIKEMKESPTEPWVDHFRDEALVSDELAGSPLKSKIGPDENGIVEIQLKNGIRIIIKSTDNKNDEVLFTATSPGGSSLVSDKDYLSSLFACQIVGESGLGSFDNIELKKKLKGKEVFVNAYLGDVREGLTGRSSPKDLETLLQLVYLQFTSPRKDSATFAASLSRTNNQLKFVKNNPVYAFLDTLTRISGSNDPRAMAFPKEDQLKEISLDKVFEIYKQRFANAGDFIFYFVGNIDLDSSLPLFEKYLGSLPVNDQKEQWKNENPPFPDGVTEFTLRKGSDPKAMVNIIFSDKLEWNDSTLLYLRMLKEVAHIKLIETIREEMSGVYSPRVQLSISKFPEPEFSLSIQFGCAPGNTKKLSKAVFKIFESLKKKGPTATDLGKVQELLIRERETDLKNNLWWLGKMTDKYFQGDEPGPMSDYNQWIEKVSIADLKAAAGKFFIKGHYLKGVLLPEK